MSTTSWNVDYPADRPYAANRSELDRRQARPASSAAPWRVYNIGNHSPVELLEVVRLLEEAIGIKAKCDFLPMQPGDVPATYADVEDLAREVDFKPATSIADGIGRFVHWFQAYHRLQDMSMAARSKGSELSGQQRIPPP